MDMNKREKVRDFLMCGTSYIKRKIQTIWTHSKEWMRRGILRKYAEVTRDDRRWPDRVTKTRIGVQLCLRDSTLESLFITHQVGSK